MLRSGSLTESNIRVQIIESVHQDQIARRCRLILLYTLCKIIRDLQYNE